MKLNFEFILEVLKAETLRLSQESYKTLYNPAEFYTLAIKMRTLYEQIEALKTLENLTKPIQLH